jgi:hypothetical protein
MTGTTPLILLAGIVFLAGCGAQDYVLKSTSASIWTLECDLADTGNLCVRQKTQKLRKCLEKKIPSLKLLVSTSGQQFTFKLTVPAAAPDGSSRILLGTVDLPIADLRGNAGGGKIIVIAPMVRVETVVLRDDLLWQAGPGDGGFAEEIIHRLTDALGQCTQSLQG